MADETKPAAPATGDVPTAAKDSGQTAPPNKAATEAARADEPGKAVTAAEQGGEEEQPAKDPNATKDYVLKEGMEHSAIIEGSLRQFKEGDKVPLNEAQFAAFGDKFEAPAGKKK